MAKSKNKIKYGKVDVLPHEFDPENCFIRIDFYDKVKAERDKYRKALEFYARQSEKAAHEYLKDCGETARNALKKEPK